MSRSPFPITDPDLAAQLSRPAFPLSSRYDPWWLVENQMGPNPLWLAESLLQRFQIPPHGRILDLGCGKALTSIFLANEVQDAEIWATDLWIRATDNQQRIDAAGLTDRVFAIHAEAHDLPFGDAFFDAIVSLDAYHYFGTDDLYLGYVTRFLRPGGRIGIVVPGLVHELEQVPAHLRSWWKAEFWSFHSPSWWSNHWRHSGLVQIEVADLIPDGWRLWADWARVCVRLPLNPLFPGDDLGRADADALEEDKGRTLGFTGVVARKL